MISREPVPIRRRRSTRSRRWLWILLGVLAVGSLFLTQLVALWTDYLWYQSVDLTSVWTTLVFTRVGLWVAGLVVSALLLWINLWLADRLAPPQPPDPMSPDAELIQRYQEWVLPRSRRIRLWAAVIFGGLVGVGAAAWWEDLLLWSNSRPFGIVDPEFGTDLSFYVFRLPIYRDLFEWAFQFILVTTLIVAAVHYLNGSIAIREGFSGIRSGVKVHLSVLLAILAGLKAVGYWLDRFDLLYSGRGAVFGASYTDVNARLPALNLLIGISIFAAILLLVNIRRRGWIFPAVAVGLWLVTSVVVGGIIPAAVQRFSVEPDEINKELPFVERHIGATRDAYGLAGVEVRSFAASADLDAADVAVNQPTIDNLRLWDPSVLITTYRQEQELRTYYEFEDVDVDRYRIGDDLTQVMLATRELDQDNIPGGGWVNTHLVYTHGFGAVLSPANAVSEGDPDFFVKDIDEELVPLVNEPRLGINQPRIYFGEGFSKGSFVIVNTDEKEIDFPTGTGDTELAFNQYDGAGGVSVGSFLRRLAFALRFGDFNTLISGQLTGDSRVLMVRNIKDRVEMAAPFLHADSDPYQVILDGRLVWVVDLYTTTNRYPYSEPATTARLNAERSELPSSFNYLRNSVKATVDAFDGTMTFYVVDDTDPLVQVYREIFPDVFTDGDEMPQELREHLRYPEDLFRVQSDMYTLYHVTDNRVFFNTGDPWSIARDPSTTPLESIRDAGVYVDGDGRTFVPMVPYYLLMRLPDEEDLSFLIMQPFTPQDRPNMIGFLVAKSDPDSYGEIVDFELPRDTFVDGPGQVGAFINQDEDISREFTLRAEAGSEVIQGNMLVVPVEESIIYVQPIYLLAEQQPVPEFWKVVVAFEDKIVMSDTLDEALGEVFGTEGPPTTTPPTTVPGGGVEVPGDVADLVEQANQALLDADQALADQDLALYQEKVNLAADLIRRIRELLES